MNKAQEIIEELDALEEESTANFKKLNAMINKIAMANDSARGGKGADPKMLKDAKALLKKMTDTKEISPNDLKQLAGRLSKHDESLDEEKSPKDVAMEMQKLKPKPDEVSFSGKTIEAKWNKDLPEDQIKKLDNQVKSLVRVNKLDVKRGHAFAGEGATFAEVMLK